MSSSRTSARKGSSQRAPFTPTVRFAIVYVLALVISLAVWFFYRDRKSTRLNSSH